MRGGCAGLVPGSGGLVWLTGFMEEITTPEMGMQVLISELLSLNFTSG